MADALTKASDEGRSGLR